MSDTFTASDFESAASASSSEPAATDTSTPVETSAPVETTAQPDGATTQPAAETTAPLSTEPAKPTGPIPFEVHKTALDNARTKAVEEWRQQHGWAEQVDPREFQQIQSFAKHFAGGDFMSGLQSLIAEGRKDPAVEAQIRSFAARTLAQRQPQTEDQEPQPDLPIQLEDGRVVHLYSAGQQAKREAFLHKQWLQSVQQELQPLKQTHQAFTAERAALAKQQEISHFVTSTFQDVQTWPGMDTEANRVAVAKELATARVNSDDPREVSLALNAAYRKVVLPTLQTASRKAVLNDINRQAAASTVNPAQTSTRAPKSMDDMSIAEALQFVASQQT